MLTGISARIREAFQPSFALSDVKDFPLQIYQDQLSVYNDAESWYTGTALEDVAGLKKSSSVDLVPLRINPIRRACQKHAYMLFGETDGMPLQVLTKPTPRDDAEKAACELSEKVLLDVWGENDGRALLMENAILSQIYGGCIFKASYVPWEAYEYGGALEYPVRIEVVNPKDAVLIPSAGNLYSIAEAWIVKQIRAIEAREYGYPANDDDIYYWWIEHWQKGQYTIQINEKTAVKVVNGGSNIPLGGTNPFGVVPVVYIPHVRDGRFYGGNAIDDLRGLTIEQNLRIADYGDAVNDDAHPLIVMHDVNGTPRFVTINEWLEVLNLNTTSMLTGNEQPPKMFEVRKAHSSPAMKDLTEILLKEFRRASYIPAVADGEDEGSQRSAMTLAVRFWPLLSHAGIERDFFGPGFLAFQRIILRVLASKKLAGITEKHTRLRMKIQWAPQLPQDRPADVQEWNLRKTSEIASIRHLIGLAGDVEDIEAEREEILKDVTDIETIKAKIAKEFAPEPVFGQPFGNQSKPAPKKPSTTAAEPAGGSNDRD